MDVNSVNSSETDIAESRDAIMRRFETWLNCALAEEPLPPGLPRELLTDVENGDSLPPIEGHYDLYSLYSALTALTQEIKLQSRSFKQLSDTLAQLSGAVASIVQQHSAGEFEEPAEAEEAAGHEETSSAAAESAAGKRHLDLLLDLRDRFERGLNSVDQASRGLFPSRRPWWRRWSPGSQRQEQRIQQVVSALGKGYSLTLGHVDQALQDYHVTPIICQGEKFDCHRMTAVDIEETDSVPEGTVVEVYRTGYEWQGEVFRSALVRVARKPNNVVEKLGEKEHDSQ